MAALVATREMENKITETEEIKALRKEYGEDNEQTYKRGGLESLANMLSGVSEQKIYVGKEARIYFEILDTRNFLKKKYTELSDIEVASLEKDVKKYVEDVLQEAEETLDFFEAKIL